MMLVGMPQKMAVHPPILPRSAELLAQCDSGQLRCLFVPLSELTIPALQPHINKLQEIEVRHEVPLSPAASEDEGNASSNRSKVPDTFEKRAVRQLNDQPQTIHAFHQKEEEEDAHRSLMETCFQLVFPVLVDQAEDKRVMLDVAIRPDLPAELTLTNRSDITVTSVIPHDDERELHMGLGEACRTEAGVTEVRVREHRLLQLLQPGRSSLTNKV